ncbi:transporter substrate-binding domain-containing protein [Shewanella sp. 3B26]|uniref:Transporter substrate-binding domain-containing protein n=1 Tax=Shewanella zhuhaiensis TaxID=2919576 RepID=A0AAJ1BDJ0_9GAMM|nr:transporter substrate-binding domain-containing protein [Shewanella zhuhaiensis]MCH4292763.1 transporter substrate-binding domain-containing protein [Shewanella zhuhaiensis]
MDAARLFRQLLLFVLLTLLSTGAPRAAETLGELNLMTEEYPPFNFTHNGKLQGMAVDLLLAAARQNDSPVQAANIRVFPWTRAYTLTLHGKNSVLFSTTRTPERESLFHWVGPISPIRLVLLARKESAIRIKDASELERYRIGVVRDDIGEVTLSSMGLDHRLQSNASTDLLLKMMARGRIDLWAYEETVARWLIKEAGMSFDDFEVVYVLKEAELYYAFSRDVPAPLRDRLQRAIDAIKTADENGNSHWQQIRSLYLD